MAEETQISVVSSLSKYFFCRASPAFKVLANVFALGCYSVILSLLGQCYAALALSLESLILANSLGSTTCTLPHSRRHILNAVWVG